MEGNEISENVSGEKWLHMSREITLCADAELNFGQNIVGNLTRKLRVEREWMRGDPWKLQRGGDGISHFIDEQKSMAKRLRAIRKDHIDSAWLENEIARFKWITNIMIILIIIYSGFIMQRLSCLDINILKQHFTFIAIDLSFGILRDPIAVLSHVGEGFWNSFVKKSVKMLVAQIG